MEKNCRLFRSERVKLLLLIMFSLSQQNHNLFAFVVKSTNGNRTAKPWIITAKPIIKW